MITEYFWSEDDMNTFINEHGIQINDILSIGKISGGIWLLSYQKS